MVSTRENTSQKSYTSWLQEQKMQTKRSFPVLQNLGEIMELNLRDSVLYLTGMDKIILLDLRLLNESMGGSPKD